MKMRVGHGYDVHRLVEGRRLILGGVEISWEKGLLGHSDADVLTHAVMDALLGAAGLGDIGTHFPDTDSAYAGADSIKLLERVTALLDHRGWKVGNIDATILAQRPKLAPHIPQMRELPFFSQAHDIARYHHERWDGRGYPEGLKGDEIPLWAQIVSIADVYDALVSPRCYKKPLPLSRLSE